VGKRTRATVRHCKYGGGTIHVLMRPQDTPPAKTSSEDNSQRWGHTNQHTDNTLPGSLDGCPPDVRGAVQPMHEESQGSRGHTLNLNTDRRVCSQACNSCPSVMCPSGRTIWEQALVQFQRTRQMRQPPTSPQSTSKVQPACTAHNHTGCTYE